MLILNCVTGKGGAIFVSMCGGCEKSCWYDNFSHSYFFLKRKQIALIKCTLCQGHYDFFLFRFLFYIYLLCRGIKVMPLIDCFHLLL